MDKCFIKVYASNWGFIYIDVNSVVAYKVGYDYIRVFLSGGNDFFIDTSDAGCTALMDKINGYAVPVEEKSNEISPY